MAILAAAAGLPAHAAETWPARPVKMIIPFPAGGATDYGARTMGMALADAWRQPVVFENRAGAGSTIGTEAGARSAPDGYTLVMGIPAGVSIAPHLYPCAMVNFNEGHSLHIEKTHAVLAALGTGSPAWARQLGPGALQANGPKPLQSGPTPRR